MGRILENWRIPLASLFAMALIVGAFLLAHGFGAPSLAQASTETELLQAIASKDSNGDGLPDWQKALYGIPMNATTTDYFNLGMTDGEAVAKGLIVPKAVSDLSGSTTMQATLSADGRPNAPADGTLTAAFAQSFFTIYLQTKQRAGGADLSQDQLQGVANEALTALKSSIIPAPDYKTTMELVRSTSGPEALTTFAASAETLLLKNSNTATSSELSYVKYALNGDAVAFNTLSAIAKSYRDSATGLAVLPVPPELAVADLELINALMRTSSIINDFRLVGTDPLAAILALTQYPSAIQSLAKAFTDIGGVYHAAGVNLVAGSPGASFANLAEDAVSAKTDSQP